MFGKDIDQFLEESDWDLEAHEGQQEASSKLRNMERQYAHTSRQ